ncbi:MAG: hypothetical protein ACI9W2_003546 [Gammaproteobacteria bacterium]|jgi:hypothetical protein
MINALAIQLARMSVARTTVDDTVPFKPEKESSMKPITTILLSLALLCATTGIASAKCYKFSNVNSDIGVCVKGDSFADRKKAKEIFEKAGHKPGSVSSYSSSCHSNSNKCYDENGKAQRSLSGY